ncbi:MAG: hypothetical protein U9R57_09310 [Thermodesulfobacteriota bacterium]|nr:hypothetical protein [Thermodesulfobacteriota bacterium]
MQHKNCLFNVIFFIFFFLLLFSLGVFSSVQAKIADTGYDETLEAFSRVVSEDEGLFQANKGLIRELTYTNKRALRAFSQLDTVSAPELVAALKRLHTEKIRFDNLLLLEQFVTLQGADVDISWQFLEKLDGLDYAPGRVMTAFVLVSEITAMELLGFVDQVKTMDASAGWAFKAFLELPDVKRESIAHVIEILKKMSERQQWTTEQCCKIKGMNARNALHMMALIPNLSITDAWNAQGFLKQDVDPETAFTWLKHYFSVGQQQKEEKFFLSSPAEKALLLKGFAEVSDYLTWKINDLHSVTNLRGREISAGTLGASSVNSLDRLWKRLDWQVQEKYKTSFYNSLHSGKKKSAIAILRKATAKARVQAAHDITTANIYILLSKGSELYDSSFRDILVPVLKDRIDIGFGVNLLQFLLETDPENNHVSDFIISLAQRGKLSVFFPVDHKEQEQVLDLVTQSAFQDENSLILFSATFMKLLETIEPQTRTYLIGKMLSAIYEQNTVLTIQLRVILQYYLEYYSEFVSEVDKIRIKMMMYEYGAIPLQMYTKPAFIEWKSDGQLSSLSVFHDDDDGRQSYLSNCHYLSRQGYRPRLSTSFILGVSSVVSTKTTGLLRSYTASPGKTRLGLFRLQRKNPLVLDWVKTINGITVSHSVFVFQGEQMQKELLKQFLTGGHEMFAQRGHSYWRAEQLLEPISKLLEDGAVTADDLQSKQRFLSLGSCGGIRAYSDLATLFGNNVDILATVGTGKAVINNPYNQFLFEAVAKADGELSWDNVSEQSSRIFKQGLGEDYLQPGSLPAILHKMMDQKLIDNGTD